MCLTNLKRGIVVVFMVLFGIVTQAQDTIQVTAKGYGRLPREAEKDAVRAAVQQAVGLFVDSETQVKNEDVIFDQVLTYADGYIEKMDVKSPPSKNADGLYETTILAIVRKNKIEEKIRTINLGGAKVNGADLWAKEISLNQNEEDGARLLSKLLNDISVDSLLRARVVDDQGRSGAEAVPSTKRLQGSTGGNIGVAFNIEVTFDRDAFYKNVVPKMMRLLDVIGKKVSDKTMRSKPGDSFGNAVGFPAYIGSAMRSCQEPRYSKNPDLQPSRDTHPNEFIVAIGTGRDRSGLSQSFAVYRLDAETYRKVWCSVMGKNKPLRVSLESKNGDEIARKEINLEKILCTNTRNPDRDHSVGKLVPLNGCHEASLTRVNLPSIGGRSGSLVSEILYYFDNDADFFSAIMITPEFSVGSYGYCDVALLRFEAELHPDDLKQLAEIKLSF